MDKKDATPQRLVRPTATRPKTASKDSSTNGNKNDSAPMASPSTSITGDIVKKLTGAMNTAISPLNANRPGRLPSFRGDRDLTLGGARSLNSPSATDSGAKPKKEFKPTIPVRRAKAQDTQAVKEEKSEPSGRGRGRGRGGDGARGRGRGRQDLIQTTGSIFGDGVSELGMKNRSSSSYGDREGGGNSSAGLEKPRLNTQNTKINKEEEDAALSALLKDDFIDDYELGDGFDSDLVMQPIQLPKSSLGTTVKEEVNDSIKAESQPTIELEGGITIKQEKGETKPIPASTPSTYHRRLKPSQITGQQVFQNEGDILFIQLPDVLPSLKGDKERLQVKTEPGTIQDKVSEPQTSDAKPIKEGVFEDIPEGRLGTLRIHKSGKLILQMGEHSFVLDSATQVSYLQDLISIEVNAEEKTGKMTALGPIKYKTVCLPDWDELIDDDM